jgi:hypothetical protein
MTDTDDAFLLYYRPCPYDRHDLYLPSIPASLQTLGRFECAVASAPAPHGLRIIIPLTLTLVFSEPSGRLQKMGPEFFLPSVHRRFGLCPCAPTLVSSSSPSSRCLPLGMSFSSLSFSPHLKFSYSEAFFFLFPPSIGLGLPDPSPLILLKRENFVYWYSIQ